MNCPYTVKVIEEIDNGPGYWNYTMVGIYKNEELIYKYQRNYKSLALSTFHPFCIDDVWYALYSKDYQTVHVLNLDTLENIGESSEKFCPMDMHIPRVARFEEIFDGKTLTYGITLDGFGDIKEDLKNVVNIEYFPIAFVSGCFWGDDSSEKLRMIDLNEAILGNVQVVEGELGYLELWNNSNLKDSIDIDLDYDEDGNVSYSINIAVPKRVFIGNGGLKKFLNPKENA